MKSSRPTSSFITREPPHQQPSQQHNFAAPRKGLLNLNSHVASNANTNINKDLNTKLVQNSMVHNKENLADITNSSGESKPNENCATASTSNTAGGNSTTSTTSNFAVTAGNGGATKTN